CGGGESIDCPDPATQTCVDGEVCECSAPGGCLQACTTDADCPGDDGLCSGGSCTHVWCRSNSNCSPGYVCGVVLFDGASPWQDSSPKAGERRCVPAGAGAPGAACTSESDCASGYCHLGQ